MKFAPESEVVGCLGETHAKAETGQTSGQPSSAARPGTLFGLWFWNFWDGSCSGPFCLQLLEFDFPTAEA